MAQQELAKENAAQPKVAEASSDLGAAESSTSILFLKASTVTKEQFEVILPHYDSVFCYLCEEGLKTGRIPDVGYAKRYVQMDLERYGWTKAPDDSMNVRKEALDGPFINKKDLEMLMEWKLWVTKTPLHEDYERGLQLVMIANLVQQTREIPT